MIVYHGSTSIIEKPNISHSKKYLDFGCGFYLTGYEEQAQKWAVRKASRQKKVPIINVYEMSETLENYKILSFENENEQWLDFVCSCRKGEMANERYDVIFGKVANDDVFKTIDLYFRNLWSKEKAIEELRYYKLNNQICIAKQDLLEEILVFKYAYEVKTNDR